MTLCKIKKTAYIGVQVGAIAKILDFFEKGLIQMRSMFTVAVLLFAVSFLRVASAADNAVVPIDWNRFTIKFPNDANAELQKAISKNTVKYALTTWYTEMYGAQLAGNRYLDIFNVSNTKFKYGQMEFRVRSPAMQAYGIATAIKLGLYDAEYTGVSEQAALEICNKLVRSIAYGHKVNKDGGWGNDGESQWQGGYWAAIAGQAGWLTWELHDDHDKENIRKMVEWEANRLMNYAVPYYMKKDGTIVTPGDSKAEENAWNSNVLFLGCAMMPNHENYDKWYKKAVEYVISAYSHPQDVSSDTIVSGKPLKEWLNGSNVEDNYAVINHNRIHPDYMYCVVVNLWNASFLTLGGKPTPEGAFFNADKIYRSIVEWNYPSPPYAAPGGTIYQPDNYEFYFPQGTSWGTRRYATHGAFSVAVHAYGLDKELTRNGVYWANLHLRQALELQNRFDDGRMFADGELPYMSPEAVITHETAIALWATWAALQPDFKITKDAPKE